MRTALFVSCVAIYFSTQASLFAGDNVDVARRAASQHPQQPLVAVDGKGTIHIVFGVGDGIRYYRPDNHGKSFNQPKALPTVRAMSLGIRRGPRIAMKDSAICVTAIGGKQSKGRDGDLLAWRSFDDVALCSKPVRVNDIADAACERLRGMSASETDEVSCVWLDLQSGKTEVYLSASEDDGQTWKQNVRVYRSPDGSVCESFHPSVSAGPKGTTVILFHISLGNKRDMYLATSQDATSIARARQLGKASWTLDACPMDGEMLASDGRDGIITVWRREGNVFAAYTDDSSEQRLGLGQRPWVAWSAAGPILAWTQGREGSLSPQVGKNGSPRELLSKARDPVVASHPKSEFAVVCWQSQNGNDRQVMVQLVSTPSKQRSKPSHKY